MYEFCGNEMLIYQLEKYSPSKSCHNSFFIKHNLSNFNIYNTNGEELFDSHANRQPLKGNTLGHKSLVNQSKSVFLFSPFFAHMHISLLLKSSKIHVILCLL